MRHFLRYWLALAAGFVALVGGISLIVDPYGLFRFVDKPGFNAVKPKAGSHGAMVKAYQVLRVKPRGLILGNSRAEVGFDPEHPAWPAEACPVFNLALPGTGSSATLAYLRHVLANSDGEGVAKPVMVLWGIDFMDFLGDAKQPLRDKPVSSGGRLLINPDGSPNNVRWLQQLRDFGEASLTLGAFMDSAETLWSRGNPYSPDLTRLGFNPMKDYVKIAADEGYWALFRQRNIENTKAFLRRPKDVLDASGRTSPALEDLRQVLDLSRKYGIDLKLVIYPYHAHLLEIFRITGHWQALEKWKRVVVNVLAEEARNANKDAYPLWDFSGFNEMSTEQVPSRNDKSAKVRWYWEAGHFKKELGDLILRQILESKKDRSGLGKLLDTGNIDTEINSMRTDELKFRSDFPDVVADLEQLAANLQSKRWPKRTGQGDGHG